MKTREEAVREHLRQVGLWNLTEVAMLIVVELAAANDIGKAMLAPVEDTVEERVVEKPLHEIKDGQYCWVRVRVENSGNDLYDGEVRVVSNDRDIHWMNPHLEVRPVQ